MANFWDLPKPVRERIYRLHLVQEGPINLPTFEASCGEHLKPTWSDDRSARRGMPQLTQVCKRTERETAAIYFGENTFIWNGPSEAWSWKTRIWPRHINLIRKVIIDKWVEPQEYGQGYNESFRLLRSFRGLETLVLKVDEQAALEKRLSRHPTMNWHSSLGCSPQLQLQTLHFSGIQGLRTLSKIPHVEFPPLTEEGRKSNGDSGAIIGGVLDTLVRRDLMRPLQAQHYHHKGHFRFLDLPPEVRNMVYNVLLVFPGVTYPRLDKPTSVACQLPYLRNDSRLDIAVPHSALAILQTNRQIHNETAGIFYRQNDLVFSYPIHLQDFALNLERDRLESIGSLTLFHKHHNEGGVSTMTTTMKLLRQMRGLKKFHLLVEHHMIRESLATSSASGRCVTSIEGVLTLFTLRGIADIKVRDLDLEDRQHSTGRYANRTNSSDKTVVDQQVQVLKHFNYGISLAQKGLAVDGVRRAYWWKDDEWPALGKEKCSRIVGCSCEERFEEKPADEA